MVSQWLPVSDLRCGPLSNRFSGSIPHGQRKKSTTICGCVGVLRSDVTAMAPFRTRELPMRALSPRQWRSLSGSIGTPLLNVLHDSSGGSPRPTSRKPMEEGGNAVGTGAGLACAVSRAVAARRLLASKANTSPIFGRLCAGDQRLWPGSTISRSPCQSPLCSAPTPPRLARREHPRSTRGVSRVPSEAVHIPAAAPGPPELLPALDPGGTAMQGLIAH